MGKLSVLCGEDLAELTPRPSAQGRQLVNKSKIAVHNECRADLCLEGNGAGYCDGERLAEVSHSDGPGGKG